MPVATLEGATFVEPDYSETVAIMNVRLDTPAVAPIVLGYRIVSGMGTAVDGVDVRDPYYTSVLHIDPGEQSGEISLRAIGDLDIEKDESFVVEIYRISGDVTFPGGGPVDRAVGWILDNDGGANPNAAYVLGDLITEGNAGTRQAEVEISLSRPVDEATKISYATFSQSATAGSDFVSETGAVNLVAGERSANVTVAIRGDTTPEFDEMVGVRLVNPPADIGPVAISPITIMDDDRPGPTLRVTTSTVEEPDASEIPHAFFLTLSRPSTVDVVVAYRLISGSAQDPTDVRLPYGSGTVTIPAGQTVVEEYVLRALGEIVPEADESYFIETTIVSGNALFEGGERISRAAGFIRDDDGAPNPLAIAISSTTVTEGDDHRSLTVTVELSRPAPADITVNYATRNGTGTNSARAGEDFSAASGQILFRAGQSEASFTLNILGDRIEEELETFSVVLTPQTALNGDLSASVTIFDTDTGPTDNADDLGDATAKTPLVIDALGGNDIVAGGSASDTLKGNDGNDTITGGGAGDSLSGGNGNDRILGQAGNDRLFGDGGSDRIFGDAGNDLIDGGIGIDVADGGDGNDTMRGGKHGDDLSGGKHNDLILGQAGNDRLFGDAGNDTMTGEQGQDEIRGGLGNDSLDGGYGNDLLVGDAGNDVARGGTQNDILRGGGGHDLLVGDNGHDTLAGGNGRDTLNGGAHDDSLVGGGADDLLIGGSGDDILVGHTGFDRFEFRGAFGDDTVRGFHLSAKEKIDVSDVNSIANFTDLINNHATSVGNSTQIDDGNGNTILLARVDIGDLEGSDFIF